MQHAPFILSCIRMYVHVCLCIVSCHFSIAMISWKRSVLERTQHPYLNSCSGTLQTLIFMDENFVMAKSTTKIMKLAPYKLPYSYTGIWLQFYLLILSTDSPSISMSNEENLHETINNHTMNRNETYLIYSSIKFSYLCYHFLSIILRTCE